MAHIFTGDRIKRLRLRQQWTQEMLSDEMENQIKYHPDMYRLEKGLLMPTGESLDGVLKILGTDNGEIICPMLDDQPMHVYTMRYILLQALENGDLTKALDMYYKMVALKGFDSPVNQQFLMSQQARIWELQGRPVQEIKQLVMEAIYLTYKDFDPDNLLIPILLFEEFELLHTLSRLEAAMDNNHHAINLSNALYNAINNAPIGYRDKRQKLVPVLLTRAFFQEKIGDYTELIKTCDEGLDISVHYYAGRCAPNFVQYKAVALSELNRMSEALPFFKQAYMGYSLLHDRFNANNVIDIAHKYGLTFELHGVDKLNLHEVPFQIYARRTPPACKTFGDLIRALRKEAGLTKKALCNGIISEANMSRFESNQIPGHMDYIKPMLERLGCEHNLYCNFYLNKNDYDNKYLRDYLKGLIIKRKFDEAEELLIKLKNKKKCQKRANLQFIKSSELFIFIGKKGIANPEIPALILETLKITCPHFSEDNIESLLLTLDELNLISYLASYYGSNGNEKRAVNIYEKIIVNLDTRYQDEDAKIRIYPAQLSRLATCLSRLKENKKALLVLNKAIQTDLSHRRILWLPEMLSTKAYVENEMGISKNCLSYYNMSYYGFGMFAPRFDRHEKIIKKLIESIVESSKA